MNLKATLSEQKELLENTTESPAETDGGQRGKSLLINMRRYHEL